MYSLRYFRVVVVLQVAVVLLKTDLKFYNSSSTHTISIFNPYLIIYSVEICGFGDVDDHIFFR